MKIKRTLLTMVIIAALAIPAFAADDVDWKTEYLQEHFRALQMDLLLTRQELQKVNAEKQAKDAGVPEQKKGEEKRRSGE